MTTHPPTRVQRVQQEHHRTESIGSLNAAIYNSVVFYLTRLHWEEFIFQIDFPCIILHKTRQIKKKKCSLKISREIKFIDFNLFKVSHAYEQTVNRNFFRSLRKKLSFKLGSHVKPLGAVSRYIFKFAFCTFYFFTLGFAPVLFLIAPVCLFVRL